MATTKVCTKCNEEKEFGEFYKDKTHTDGLNSRCKKCVSEKSRLGYLETKEIHAIRAKQYYEKNKSVIIEKSRKQYENNTEEKKAYSKRYYYENIDRVAERNKEWLNKNREKYREWRKEWQRNKWNSDIHFKIRVRLASRIRMAVKNNAGGKAYSTMELIGCTINEMKIFLEAEFEHGMTWDNMGEWHIDHIRPCASFDLTDPGEQKKCFHWTNLQPLWALDNIRKGAKYVC